jgi:hypothetical protein
MNDIGKSLSEEHYIEDVYLSINGVGTKVFKKCAYHEAEGYTFIWTKEEKFLISKKEMGDYVVIPYDPSMKITLKKVT